MIDETLLASLIRERYGEGGWFTRHPPPSFPQEGLSEAAVEVMFDDSPWKIRKRRADAVAEGFPRSKKDRRRRADPGE